MRERIASIWTTDLKDRIAAISNVIQWSTLVLVAITAFAYFGTHEHGTKGDYALHYWWVLALVVVFSVLHERTRDKSPYDTENGLRWW